MNTNTTVRGAEVCERRVFPPGRLMQWPCKINLVPTCAPYFDEADLLISADCAAYALPKFHELMKDKITLIGCALADAETLREKLTAIIRENDVRSITVAKLEVGCCGGIELAARKALESSGKELPFRILTLSTSGKISE